MAIGRFMSRLGNSRVSLLGSGVESGHDGSISRAISSKEREMPDII